MPIDEIKMSTCSGQILTERIVITAGHCVYGSYNKAYVIPGYLNRKEVIDPDRIREVKKVYLHPQYEEFNFFGSKGSRNDVAILKTKNNIDLLRPDVGTACLPIRDFNTSKIGFSVGEAKITILGFGVTEEQNKPSCCLRYVKNIATIEVERCKELIKRGGSEPAKALIDITMNENSFCIKGDDKKKVTTCFGDSGGGSYFKTGDSRYILVGLTSFGKMNGKVCDHRYPTAIAFINPYIGWILNVVLQTKESGIEILESS